jgi:hypothetical protein
MYLLYLKGSIELKNHVQKISRDEMEDGDIMNKRERVKTVFLYGVFACYILEIKVTTNLQGLRRRLYKN